MKPCTCGKQLDNSAKFCPSCGKTFRVTSGFTKFVGGFILVMVIVIVIIGAIGAILSPSPSAPAVVSPAKKIADQKDEAVFQRAVAGAKQLQKSMRNPDSFKLGQTLIMDSGAGCPMLSAGMRGSFFFWFSIPNALNNFRARIHPNLVSHKIIIDMR